MMKKIQEEIDSFTHGSRLPEFSDEENVPYLKAFIKEALRFWSFIPLCKLRHGHLQVRMEEPTDMTIAVPHYLSVDDEYKGYLLPAKSMIIPNTW
jgi:hypothetical protein